MKLTLVHKELDPDYKAQWNEICDDFVQIAIDGKVIRPTLYRIGGMTSQSDVEDQPFFLLLKYTPAFYEDSITKDPKRKPHLAHQWCIIDQEGNEQVVVDGYNTPYLVKGSVIYSLNQVYYNILTKKCYGMAFNVVQSGEFVFIENKYDKESECGLGVIKINKKDGSYETFPF